jgi:glycosyltransferase involved in cell wall biosynthesis
MAAHALSHRFDVSLAYRKEAVGERFQIRKYRLPFLNEADAFTALGIARIVLKHRIHVLIPTKPKDFVLAGIVSKILHRKSVARLGIVRDLRGSPINRFVFSVLNDGVITNAPEIKHMLLRSGYMKPENVKVVYNGIDQEEIDEKSRLIPNAAIRDKMLPFTVCSMGELSDRKGFDDLIRGFALFVLSTRGERRTKKTGLVIIGDGTKRKELQELADSLGVSDRVVFTGFLENPYPILRLSDVFVSSSKNEGIPNAILEAMYLKNVVIATRVGGIGHVIEHGVNGFLIGCENTPRGIARFLIRLHQNRRLRLSLAEAGHYIVRTHFRTDSMADGIAGFCKSLLIPRMKDTSALSGKPFDTLR